MRAGFAGHPHTILSLRKGTTLPEFWVPVAMSLWGRKERNWLVVPSPRHTGCVRVKNGRKKIKKINISDDSIVT